MNDKTIISNGNITLSGEDLTKFKQAIKIGYYKTMKSKGLISQSQLEILLHMQTEKVVA